MSAFEVELRSQWSRAFWEMVECDMVAERIWGLRRQTAGFATVVSGWAAQQRQIYETGKVQERAAFEAPFPPTELPAPWFIEHLESMLNRGEALVCASSSNDGPFNPNLLVPYRAPSPVEEIARDLNRTTRQVKRYLEDLRNDDCIPSDWRTGGEWRPASYEAAEIIRATFSQKARRKKAAKAALHCEPIPSANEILKWRDRRLRAEKELREIEEMERWIRLFHRTYFGQMVPESQSRGSYLAYEKLWEISYDFAGLIVGRFERSAFPLLVSLYVAFAEGSKAPLERVEELLTLSHSTYWRRYYRKQNVRKLVESMKGLGARLAEYPGSLSNALQPISEPPRHDEDVPDTVERGGFWTMDDECNRRSAGGKAKRHGSDGDIAK